MNYKNTLLFTGAGFTANFGGFLAKEMWSKIFNNPKLNNTRVIKEELRNNFDFESIYSNVVSNRNRYLENEIEIFEHVVNDAYEEMDEVIKNPSWWELSGINSAGLQKFLDYFKEEVDGKVGACFTLNQDLFMERKFKWQPLGPNPMRYTSSTGKTNQYDVIGDTPKYLPSAEVLNTYISQLTDEFSYVKLHGSSRWTTEDGEDIKVIGINKIEAINQIPLLKWYFQLFQRAISVPNTRLVILGYGFRDEHINDCIGKAVTEHGLKLFIISPEDPESFRKRIIYKNYSPRAMLVDSNEVGMKIWNAVEGYFPYRLKDVFPVSQIVTAQKSEIYKSIGIPLLR